MADTPKNIPIIIDEKMDTTLPTNLSKEQIKKTQFDLARDFDISEIAKEEVKDLPSVLPNFLKVQTPDQPPQYDYEITEALQYIEDLYQSNNIGTGIREIDEMLAHYKNKLSKKDYVHLILKKAHLQYNNKDNAQSLQTLKQLEAYKEYLSPANKNVYRIIRGNNLYEQAVATSKINENKSVALFAIARKTFDNVINQNLILGNDVYKSVMFRIALCDYKLWNLTWSESTLSQIRNVPNESKNTKLDAQILYIHGLVYQKLKQYKKAIAAFMDYLKYEPNDEETKKRIRLLSEQLGE